MGVQQAVSYQSESSAIYTVLLTILSLGQICPLLLILAPLWACTTNFTLSLLRERDSNSVSEKVVHKILVQHPSVLFPACGYVSHFAVTAFILIDYDFKMGPIVLHCVLYVATKFGIMFWYRLNPRLQRWQAEEPWSSPTCVTFNQVPPQTQIDFRIGR